MLSQKFGEPLKLRLWTIHWHRRQQKTGLGVAYHCPTTAPLRNRPVGPSWVTRLETEIVVTSEHSILYFRDNIIWPCKLEALDADPAQRSVSGGYRQIYSDLFSRPSIYDHRDFKAIDSDDARTDLCGMQYMVEPEYRRMDCFGGWRRNAYCPSVPKNGSLRQWSR